MDTINHVNNFNYGVNFEILNWVIIIEDYKLI